MKTNKSYDYWRKRQDERLTYSERVSNRTVADIASIYDDSLKRVEEKIENIVGNYAKDIIMDVNSLKELLMQHDTDDLLKGLYNDLLKTGANTPKNLEWLRGNYLKRLSREEAIKLQLENERRIVSHHEQRLSEKGYKQTIEKTYESLTKDLSGKSGKALNESVKDSMLKKRWVAGQNYSERVWKNTGQLRDEVNTVINSGLLSGRSSREIINDLAERYGVATYRAETLVRTEMNYFENQTELKSYKDFGVTHYTYLAVRDNRTSEICSTLDGQRFEVEKAEPGLNYPPMHPNCRAGTVPDLDFESEDEDDYYRVYRDPVTRERMKTNLPYEEWYETRRQGYDGGPSQYDVEIKKLNNFKVDKKQYQKYVATIGEENMPVSIEKFQELKYNETDKYETKKREYRTINAVNQKDWSESFKTNAKSNYYELRKYDIEISSHTLARLGDRGISIDHFVDIVNRGSNYIQGDGRLVYHYDGIAIIINPINMEVVTIIRRNNPRKDWVVRR